MHVATVDLIITPNPEILTAVRRFITDLYSHGLDSLDLAQRLGIATHELMENAIKYSADATASIRIVVSKGRDGVSVCTSNKGARKDIARTEQIVAAFRQESNKMALYQRMMEDSAAEEIGSGLGLARICGELDMALSTEVEGEVLRVYAHAVTSPEAA